ncbi:parB-like protein [uncultured Mediterranean phage uvMED]|nr:parB-like protein [uncultured Mediterranean phage uvMED]BAR37059.1 parB-like protein [uncultured Mediterranean phage uvMED]
MSGIFFEPGSTLSVLDVANKAKGERTDFSQNYEAAKADFFGRLRSDSKAAAFTKLFKENDQLILELGGNIGINPLLLDHPEALRSSAADELANSINDDLMNSVDVFDTEDFLTSYDTNLDFYFKELDKLKANEPEKYKDVKTRDQIDKEVIENARLAWETNQDVMRNAKPGLFGWNWGQLAGGLRAGITDPVILGTLPLGVATGGWATTGTIGMQFLKTFAVEAIIGFGAEAAIQKEVYRYNNNELDINYTAKEAIASMLTVAVASGVLGDVVLGLFKGGKITLEQFNKFKKTPNVDKEEFAKNVLTRLVDEDILNAEQIVNISLINLDKKSIIKIINELPENKKTKEVKAFLHQQEMAIDDVDQNPFMNTLVDNLKNEQEIENAVKNLHNEVIPEQVDTNFQLNESVKTFSADKIEFKIDELETDANIFQYKQGGDDFGVTERLKGVTEWNPHAANIIVAFEFANGRKVVADGHQRLGLAKRIKAQNDGQDPKLYGYLYREADGYTPEQIKIWAAIKNIQEGSGTSIDAAKILRLNKTEFNNFKKAIPPRSVMVREAMAMESLSDDAFDLVARGQAESSHAALVAQLVNDPTLHLPILQLLGKAKPDNIGKARSIVLQALDSKFDTSEQLDLLGSEFITKSLVTNKADILDAAIKKLKRNKTLFKGLNQNKTKINSSGKNVLDEQFNQNQELINEKILQLIETKALRSGEQLAADLNDASVIHAKGNTGAAIEQFGDAIERANARGDFNGYDVSRSGDNAQSTNTNSKFLEEEDINETQTIPEQNFDTPAGQGQIDQGNFLQDQLEQVLDIKPKAERGEFSVDEVLQNTSPIDRKIVTPILNKIDPDILEEALTNINKARVKSKLPPFKNLDDAIDQYETDQIALNKLETTESIIDTPKREQLRFQITNQLQKNHGHSSVKDKLFKGQPKAEKKVVFVMGKPGSGKSSIEAVPLVKKLKAVLIDSDEAKKLFPEFDNGKGAGVIHEESSIVAADLTARAVDQGQNIVFPVVGADADSLLRKLNAFKENGYKIYLHNVDIPGDESYRRAFVRYLNTGRLIDHGYLISVGNKPNDVYNHIKSLNILNGYKKTDNFVKRGEKPILIEKEGGISLGEKSSKSSGKKVAGVGGEEKTRTAAEQKSLEEQLDLLRKERAEINETPIGTLVFKPELQTRAVELDKQITELSDEVSSKIPELSSEQKLLNEFIDEDFSISSKIEEDAIVPEVVSARQILSDIENDQAILNRLRDCV